MQEWTDMLAELTFTGTSHDTYFDLGTQVIVSSIVGGGAWNPLRYRPVRTPSPSAPSLSSHSPCLPPPLERPSWSWITREQSHPPLSAVRSPPPVAQPALPATPLRVKLRRVRKTSSTSVIVLGLVSALVLTILLALRRSITRALERAWRRRGWLQFATTEKLAEMPLNEAPAERESLAKPGDTTSGLSEEGAPRRVGGVQSHDLD